MPFVLILFIAMPIIEIAVLLRVGEALGWLPTLGIVVLTAVLGTAMLRQQGMATLNKARQRMGAGEMPAQQMLEGVLLMVGGVLLLTPGFVTDAFGFACLLPWSRQWLAGKIASRSVVGVAGGMGAGPGGFSMPGGPAGRPGGSTTVGSGATQGAQDSTGTRSSGSAAAGGQPKPDSGKPGRDGDVIDAEFRHIDD